MTTATRNRRIAIGLLLAGLTLMLASTSAMPAVIAANNAGGTVTNSLPTGTRGAPTVNDGAHDVGEYDNDGVDNFEIRGTIEDKNGEADMVEIKVIETRPDTTTVEYAYTILAADLSNAVEPGVADKTVQVWDNQAGEKTLDYNFQRIWATSDALGTYSFQVEVRDEGAFQSVGAAYSATVTGYANFVLNDGTDAQTYADDGSTIADGRWGGWSAEAGASTASTGAYKYIKIKNTGSESGTTTVSVTGNAFTGVTDNTWSIDLLGNVDYYYAIVADGTLPNDGGNTWLSSLDDADAQLPITLDPNEVVWVRYELTIPDPTADQVYEAGYTAA